MIDKPSSSLALTAVLLAACFAPRLVTTSRETRLHKPATRSAPKPHILIMLVDDLGWADVSYRASPTDDTQIATPVFESLLKEGIRLDRAYAYSWCAPSRSSLLSGRLPVHVNMNYSNVLAVDWSTPASGASGMPSGMSTMGDKMKEAGYTTYYNGKWGAGHAWEGQLPRARGFDHFLGYLQDSVDYYTGDRNPDVISRPNGCELAGYTHPFMVDFWRDDGPAINLLDGQTWMDEILVAESLSQIKAHDPAAPLFLIHAFHSIHTPLNPPKRLEEQYAHVADPTRRAYASMVTFVDTSVGRMVGLLKEKAMWANTLLVMTSDNGGPIYPGKSAMMNGGANNYPLKGGKTSEFEGGIRVNSFVSGGLLPASMRGSASQQYVHLADWYGTLCYLAGVDVLDEAAAAAGLPQPDSVNLWPWLSGQETRTTTCTSTRTS